jgi:hypothetical protein
MEPSSPGRPEPKNPFVYFKKALQIIQLRPPAMMEVAEDPGALSFGIVVTAIGGVLSFAPGRGPVALLIGALFSIFVLFFFAALVHLFCGYSKGKQEFIGFLRIVAVAGILDWTVVVPHAHMVIAVWSIVVSIVSARQVYQLSVAKAILAVLMSAVILWIISLMIFTGPLSSYLFETFAG